MASRSSARVFTGPHRKAPANKKQEIIACECDLIASNNNCDECRRRSVYEWSWDNSQESRATIFMNMSRNVLFNPGFSVGTAAVRGSIPLRQDYHHYWEIEMSTEVYGTDMMIGVGTDKTDLNRFSHSFVSFIGKDDQSWGLSYSGSIQHANESHKYAEPFGQHAIIGVHLNMWTGTLEFFVNRKPLGIAFRNLQNKVLYPMMSSTAARSGMNLIFSRSYPASLQLQSLLSIGKSILAPENTFLFKCINLPPGLLTFIKNNYWWIVCSKQDSEKDLSQQENENDDSLAATSKPSKKCLRLNIHVTDKSVPQSSFGVLTRSKAKVLTENAAGPASAAKNRSRQSKAAASASPSSSTSSAAIGSGSAIKSYAFTTTTNSSSSSDGDGRLNKRRFMDSKNNVVSKKK